MIAKLRGRTERQRGDRGLTLAEMLVAMMVTSLLMVMVVALVTSVTRTFTRERAATDSTRSASAAMKEVTRVIRSGTEIRVMNQSINDPVFLAATSESVVLRSYLDTSAGSPKPIVVRLEITAARDLVEKRWNANATSGPYWTFAALPAAPFQAATTFWTNPAYTRTIARGLTTTTVVADRMFSYSDKDGNAVPLDGTGAVSLANLRTIAAVTVRMSVQADKTGRASPVLLQNQVGIPNLGISRVGG
ncbi:MAG: PulJ/GspJ family protein [Cellulomonas sp.]